MVSAAPKHNSYRKEFLTFSLKYFNFKCDIFSITSKIKVTAKTLL